MSIFTELKRRNVFRVAAAYVVTAWLLIEVSATLEDTLHLPEWADSLLAMFLLLGFPVALFFSWAYEITPEGIKSEKDLTHDDSSRAVTARKLDWAVISMITLAGLFFVADRYIFAPDQDQTEPANVATAEQSPPGDTTEATSLAPELSIAVLPFVNMSSDPEQEYFSDGLTEELLNLLAGIDELKVAARTSSFFYKDKLDSVPLTEVARQLEVAHVLEGSVRKGGGKIRITAQLIKADNGYHLWSETYDRTLDDIFAIQDEIAAAVVDELKITLLGEAPHAKVIDTQSYELALQARYLFSRRAEGDLQRALELFEQAVELDPNNAAAWAGLAPLYSWLFDPPDMERVRNAAQKAIDLEPDNPEAHARLARALSSMGDSEGYEKEWGLAVELGEDSALIQSMRAGVTGFQGDLEGAIAHLQRAVALDPLYIVNLANLSSYLILARHYDEAAIHAQQAVDLAPTSPIGYHNLVHVRLLQGKTQEAKELFDRYVTLRSRQDDPTSSYRLDAMLNFSIGNQVASDAALANVKESKGGNYQVDVACIHAWRGETDEAFEWLEKALESNPDISVQFTWEPCLDSLHDDPRWADLMARWNGTSGF